MRVYLLNPPFIAGFVRCGRWQGVVARGGTLYYPIWLAYAAGVLEKQGGNVRLVDAVARRWSMNDVVADAQEFTPDLIVVDTNFSSLRNDAHSAELLRESVPGAVTVLVGPPASVYTDTMLDNKGVDIVARLEYDFTVADVAKAIQQGAGFAKIQGISYRRDGRIVHNPERKLSSVEDLDQIPFVSKVYREHLNPKDYFLGHALHPQVQIFTGRGCPNLCTFCAWPETLMGREYRLRSVDNVLAELEYIRLELPQVREVFLEDDTFTISKRRVTSFCEELIRKELHMVWSCNARASLDYETMRLMKRAGCRLLDVGYESGSDEILQRIKKGITTDQMRQFARDARRAGLMVLGDFIIGLPGEMPETAEQTIRFAKELKPNIAQFAVATPIPGTQFYKWVKANGFLLVDDLEESLDRDGFQKCIISYPEFSAQDIVAYVDKALKAYYLTPSYVPVALRNVFRKHGWHELHSMVESSKVFLRYLARTGLDPRGDS